MAASTKRDRENVGDSIQRSQPTASDARSTRDATTPAGKPLTRDNQPAQSELTAQADFMDDIRVSLQEMTEGKVLPAEKALEMIELGLDDDELEGLLSQQIHESSQPDLS